MLLQAGLFDPELLKISVAACQYHGYSFSISKARTLPEKLPAAVDRGLPPVPARKAAAESQDLTAPDTTLDLSR